jgi:hypothetical protein
MFFPLHGLEEGENFGLGEDAGAANAWFAAHLFGNDVWVIESRE